MTEVQFWEKFEQLPLTSREAVAKFMEFLLQEAKRSSMDHRKKSRSGFGSWKGIRLSADFDAPLDDMKEYSK